MLTEIVFWPLVKELYPWFLGYCALRGMMRLGKACLEKMDGNDGVIGDALNDIIVAFIFAHINVAIIMLVWYIAQSFNHTATEIVETIGNNLIDGGN